MKHEVGVSQLRMARKFVIAQSLVSDIIKESGLKYYKWRKIPYV